MDKACFLSQYLMGLALAGGNPHHVLKGVVLNSVNDWAGNHC